MLEGIFEAGHKEALLGMALSYYDGATPLDSWWDADRLAKATKRAKLLAFKGGGHNKFLESIQVWLLVKGSRTFWQEFDTYRVGISKQSTSTMHTLKKRSLGPLDFTPETDPDLIIRFNGVLAKTDDINVLKSNLPEGFLQIRQVSTNYKTLQNIIYQRQNHRLKEWRKFCSELLIDVKHPYYLINPEGDKHK